MQFSHPIVEQVLINARDIEQQVLVERRPQGDTVVRSGARNVKTCFSADMFRIFGKGASITSFGVNKWTKGSRLTADNSLLIRWSHPLGL